MKAHTVDWNSTQKAIFSGETRGSRLMRLVIALSAALLLSPAGSVNAQGQETTVRVDSRAPEAGEVLRSIEKLSLAISDVSTKLSSMEQQARSLIDSDLVTRAEHRAEELRVELLSLQLKEMELQARLEDLDYRLEPESIRRALAFVGSTRTDELRESLRIRLESEKERLKKQLALVVARRERLEAAIVDADAAVDRLRAGLNSQ